MFAKGIHFFHAIIRNFKTLGIPVSGADRLRLQSAIVVKDMISLAKFTLLQSDDLSLAEVLKGPLFCFSEEMLFEVSFGREKKGTLWKSLKEKKPEIAKVLQKNYSCFKNIPARMNFLTLFSILNRNQGSSFLRKIYLRLGLEAKDALEAVSWCKLLSIKEKELHPYNTLSMNLLREDLELKREMSENRGQVRVMTVHGAKGLEAPVVILPDTTGIPKVQNNALLPIFENEKNKPFQDIIKIPQK